MDNTTFPKKHMDRQEQGTLRQAIAHIERLEAQLDAVRAAKAASKIAKADERMAARLDA